MNKPQLIYDLEYHVRNDLEGYHTARTPRRPYRIRVDVADYYPVADLCGSKPVWLLRQTEDKELKE